MLIEFLGLPACGKSTMSRRVADLLMEQGLVVDETSYDLAHRRRKVARQRAKLIHLASFAAWNPLTAFSDVLAISGTRQASLMDLGKESLNWLYILSMAARRRSPPVVTILDQGIGQAIWSIGFTAQRTSWLDLLSTKFERAAAMLDLVVRVRADFANIGDRLGARKRYVSRMDSLGHDLEVVWRGETTGDAIAAKLQAIGVRVIEIQNNDAAQLAQGARKVADMVTTELSGQETASRLQHQRLVQIETAAVEHNLAVVSPFVNQASLPTRADSQLDAKRTPRQSDPESGHEETGL
jgi:hypothetical protein